MTRLLAIVTDAVEGPESIEAIKGPGEAGDVEVRVILPAVEETPFRHALGDVDVPAREARERLAVSLEELRRSGIAASGAVGDADPVLAAQDALREAPADEVVIFERSADQARWFEDGLFERAQEELMPPLRMVVVSAGANGAPHIVGIEQAGAGLSKRAGADRESQKSENLPRFSPGDLAGMVIGVVGTIVAIVLAAAGPGPETAAGAAAILIAIGVALLNMAHVVGAGAAGERRASRSAGALPPHSLADRHAACRAGQPDPAARHLAGGGWHPVAERVEHLIGELRAFLRAQGGGVDAQHDAVVVELLERDARRVAGRDA